MAIGTHLIVDGPRNTWIKYTGVQSDTVTLLPSSLSGGGPGPQAQTPNEFAIIGWGWWSEGPSLDMFWQASVNVLVATLPHDQSSDHILDLQQWFDGIPNNGGAGKTGGLVITAQATPTGNWTLILGLRKKYP